MLRAAFFALMHSGLSPGYITDLTVRALLSIVFIFQIIIVFLMRAVRRVAQ